MNRDGAIILIEDDPDDIEVITTAVTILDLPNPLVTFTSGRGVVEYLTDPKNDPLLVISDINLPGLQGIDLYVQLIAETAFAAKDVPYVFLSTSPGYYKQAAAVSKCGYFVKPRDYFAYVSIVQRIVLYWKDALTK
jgi:CheY-like chemotaxis protein